MSKAENISYIEHCFKKGQLIRWPDNTMPLAIYVAPFRWYKAKDQEYNYYKMLENALILWEKASGGKVSFKPVSQLYESQINFEWKRVERESLGHCYFNFDKIGRLYSAEVSIGLSDGLLHKEYQNANEVYHTMIHEIGHALGLQHSPSKKDVMYVPHQYGLTKISKRDYTTLKWLYKFPYGITKEEILTHYKLPSNYNIDKLIYMLETGTDIKEIQPNEENKAIINNEAQLKEEQNILANVNKFNLSMQNISVSKDVQEYFKKIRIKKEFKNK